jgi:hypothetical protein
VTLTFEQATAITNHYQHLKGKELCVSGKGCGIIENIVVAPFDDINKFIFLRDLTEHGNPVSALEFYSKDSYDVLLVAKDYNGHKTLVTQDIRTYLSLTGFPLDLKRYTSDRSC